MRRGREGTRTTGRERDSQEENRRTFEHALPSSSSLFLQEIFQQSLKVSVHTVLSNTDHRVFSSAVQSARINTPLQNAEKVTSNLGRLVHVVSQNITDFLLFYIGGQQQLADVCTYWIGLEKDSGTFTWQQPALSLAYTNWACEEPQNATHGVDNGCVILPVCAAVNSTSGWTATPCSSTARWVCEIDLNAPTGMNQSSYLLWGCTVYIPFQLLKSLPE